MYLEKIKDLASKYRHVRRTRPDGNCFFRAFSYAILEKLLCNKDSFNTFYKLAENSKNILVELGFQQFTVEDFYETVSNLYVLVLFCISYIIVVYGSSETFIKY